MLVKLARNANEMNVHRTECHSIFFFSFGDIILALFRFVSIIARISNNQFLIVL